MEWIQLFYAVEWGSVKLVSLRNVLDQDQNISLAVSQIHDHGKVASGIRGPNTHNVEA